MTSLSFQETLLSLYLDEHFIRAFAQDKERALASLKLPERERKALLSLPSQEVEHFSRELIYKRHRVAQTIWDGLPEEKRPIFYFPFHKSGAVLFVHEGGEAREIALSSGMDELFFELAETNAPLLWRNLLEAAKRVFLHSLEEKKSSLLSLADLFRAVRLIRRRRLSGKTVRRIL